MLVIRLQRIGKKHQASFRIVLQDSKWKPQGKALELLGFYNPRTKEKQIQAERVKFWLAKGAQPSPTLHNMLVDAGIVAGEKVKAWRPKKGSIKKESATPTAEKPAEPIESPPEEKIETTAEPVTEEVSTPTSWLIKLILLS